MSKKSKFAVFLKYVALCALMLLVACGNKGDLYIDTRETILAQITSIDEALDELELMEAEEEKEQ